MVSPGRISADPNSEATDRYPPFSDDASLQRMSGKAPSASQTTTENSPAGKTPKTCPAASTKIFRLTRRANHLYKLAPSHPKKGRIASRHERAVGCDGRDSVGRAMGSQGGSSRERSDGARTNDAANRLCQNSPGGTRRGKIFGVDGRGRRSRVVLAPRCWRQVLRRCIRPNRVRDVSSIRKATVARKPGHRGEFEVSRKPFAQGKPE